MAWALVAAIMPIGCSGSSLLVTTVSMRRPLVETEMSRDAFFTWAKIALIDVSGIIQNEPEGKMLSTGEHPVSLLLEQLDKARRDRSVKAVILRINSPGGTVVASELMHDEITHFRKSGKPIIAVMMDVAASGGYYIACACDEILAQRSTVTGSIGVVMQMFNLNRTLEMIGVGHEAITSGPFKDAGSPFRTLRDNERELFQDIIDEMYDRFVQVVAAGRPDLDEAAVRRLADGRVYTASQALKAGLIDGIAGMREAVAVAKRRAGVDRVRLVSYHRPEGYRPNYYAATPTRPGGDLNLLRVDLSHWPTRSPARFLYLWSPGT